MVGVSDAASVSREQCEQPRRIAPAVAEERRRRQSADEADTEKTSKCEVREPREINKCGEKGEGKVEDEGTGQ